MQNEYDNSEMESNLQEDIEDDEVIVLRGDNQDYINSDMLQYFEKPHNEEIRVKDKPN